MAPNDPSDASATVVDSSPPPAPNEGTRIGRYTTVALVGRGGMGLVYRAYDPELDRVVALKLLRADLALRAETEGRTRLLREARAVARLAHPNVVTVFDVGAWEGGLFIAMEYVDGEPLSRWLERRRPRRDIVDAFVQAGRGLAAAHAAGIVHRDFKPANVLVGKDGRARVTDFGLARLLGTAADTAPCAPDVDVSPLTTTGMVVGTPAYMAPEQARGETIDDRSDQFSFAVALYEALYDERPFTGRTLDEVCAAAALGRVRPPPPGTRVPRRLRHKILVALRGRPDDRYPSMTALLRALGTSRLSGGARLALVALPAITAVALAVHAVPEPCRGGADRLAGVWDPEVQRAVAARFGERQALYPRVAALLDDYTRRWTQMHASACRATRVDGRQAETVLALRMACLDRRLEHAAALTHLLASADAEAVRNAAAAVEMLPSLEPCADAAALTAIVPVPEDPAHRAQVAALRAQLAVARAHLGVGRAADGIAVAQATAALARELAYHPLLGEAQLVLGELEAVRGDAAAAEGALFDGAVAAAAGRDDRTAALAWIALAGVVGDKQARFAEAHRLLRLAEAAVTRAGSPGELRLRLASVRGRVLLSEGKLDEARGHFEEARQLSAAIHGEDDPRVLRIDANVAKVMAKKGDLAGARARLERVVAAIELRSPGDPLLGHLLSNLGSIVDQLGDRDRARATLERAETILEAAYGPTSPELVNTLNNLAAVHVRSGRTAEATAAMRRALTLLSAQYGDGHPQVAGLRHNLAVMLARDEDFDGALAELEQARRVYLASLGPESAGIAQCDVLEGAIRLRQRRFVEAEEALARSVVLFEKALGPRAPEVAEAVVRLADARQALGRRREALSLYERALSVYAAVYGDASPAAERLRGEIRSLKERR